MGRSGYLMTWLNGAVTIAGPFAYVDACFCGEAWQSENGDNPCWQVLDACHGLNVEVVSPGQLPWVETALERRAAVAALLAA